MLKNNQTFSSLLVLITILSQRAVISQPLQIDWLKTISGRDEQIIQDVIQDKEGNIHLTGYFSGTTDFDPGTAVVNKETVAETNYDMFICSLDSNGNYIGVKTYGSGYPNYINSIAMDDSANMYASGFTYGVAIESLSVPSSAFVVKLNKQGKAEWARSMRAEQSSPTDVWVDKARNIYFIGYFYNNASIDKSANDFVIHTNTGRYDVAIIKYNSEGKYLWSRSFGGRDSDISMASTIDERGNIYVTGYFYSTVDFDSGEGQFLMTATGSNAFVTKFDSSGKFVWARKMSGTPSNHAKIHYSKGNLYLGSSFYGKACVDFSGDSTFVTSAGMNDLLISKMDTNGNLIWFKQIEGPSGESIYSITTDQKGNVISTGAFTDRIDIDPSPLISRVLVPTKTDGFIQILDSLGNYVSSEHFSSTNRVSIKKVISQKSGNFLLAGQYLGTAIFEANNPLYSITSNQWEDIVLIKSSPRKIVTDLQTTSSVTNMVIYPNPSTGTFTFSGDVPKSGQINITDLSGKTIFQSTSSDLSAPFNLGQDKKGIFLVEVLSEHIIFRTVLTVLE